MKFVGNDTIALVFLGAIGIIGLIVHNENVTLTALGAIGGYIGAMKKGSE